MAFPLLRRRPTLAKILGKLREEMPRLQDEYFVKSLHVYGDYAKGTDQADSQVDIMVEYERAPTLFQFVQLQRLLGEILGVTVHLADRHGLEEKYRLLALDEGVPV